jgi:transposase
MPLQPSVVESLLAVFNVSAFRLMLTVEEIYRTYHFGPRAVIELFEKHLGQAYLHPPPPESMLEKTIQGQTELIERLEKQVERLQQELRRQRYHNHQLKKRLAELEEGQPLPLKDSHNSHLPPSKDLPSRRRIRSLRQPSGLKPGGQPGHPGRTLRLAENPDRVMRHSPQQCLNCQASLETAQIVATQRRQVIELPPVKLEVIEHRAETRKCHSCGRVTKGEFPEDVRSPVRYGPRLRACAIYLSQYQLLPYARVCELLSDWFGVKISEATLRKSIGECSKNLVRVEARIKSAIRRVDVIHADETVLRVGNNLKYVHVASTGSLTHYGYEGGRGKAAIDAIAIVPNYKGVIVRDAYPAYDQYQNCKHSLCNAHLLRDLTYLSEASQKQKQWAEPMKRLLQEMKGAVDEAVAEGRKQLTRGQAKDFDRRYDELTKVGWEVNGLPAERAGPEESVWEKVVKPANEVERKGMNLALRVRLRKEEVLRFMLDLRVPFDNNQAERDLRMIKLQQKICGCFRTEEGVRDFCRVRGYVSTMRKRGRDILCALEAALRGQPLSLSP